MPETRHFSNNGYDVKVYKKQDILDTIDTNIIDKEVALELISQLEIDAENFLLDGIGVTFPYLGRIWIPPYKKESLKLKETREYAKSVLSKEKYIMFAKELNSNISKALNEDRYKRHKLREFIVKNRSLFEHITSSKGEVYAKALFSTLVNMKQV